MDEWEHRALISALVVLGCLTVGIPALVLADGGTGPVGDGPPVVVDERPSMELVDVFPDSADDSGAFQTDGEGNETDGESNETDGESDDGDGGDADDDGDETGDGANETDDDGNATDGTGLNGADDAFNETDDELSLGGYDDLQIEISLHENGSATWTLEYQYRLDDEDEDGDSAEDWGELQADIEERESTYLEVSDERWSAAAMEASATTGRTMTTDDFAVETDERDTPQEHGYVRFTFTWKSFAHVEMNRIEAGDAIEGFNFDDRTELRVSWPETYNATSITPEPDESRDTAVIWHFEDTSFLEGEPRIELIQAGGDDGASDETTEEGSMLPWMLAGIGAGGVLVGALWWIRRTTGERTASGSDTVTSTPDESVREGPPLELLSNEERVVRLLEDNGGRIKQQAVISELDWTEAKTSQVVRKLREGGEIEVFRIGRENVLVLPSDEMVGSLDDLRSDTGSTSRSASSPGESDTGLDDEAG